MRLRWIVLFGGALVVVILVLLLLLVARKLPGASSAQPSSARLAAGPYVTMVNLSANPPQVGQPLHITVVPRTAGHLVGQIIALPQTGTDSMPVHAPLSLDLSRTKALAGSLELPVRGSWRLMIELDGPQGYGIASLDVTAVVPFELPAWLGWLLGLSPLIGCAWFIWHQWRYRRQLLTSARSA